MITKRSITILGCFLVVFSLVSLCAVPVMAATWTKIANNGVSNANNIEMGPGVVYKGMQTIFSTPITGIMQPPGDISMYTYNGSTFTQVGPDSFNNHNIKGTQPTAVYEDKLYIGTANGTDGGEIFVWDGSGDPVRDDATANGFGLGGSSDTVIPLDVVDDKLLVAVNRSMTNLPFLLYEYDGDDWTMIAGPGAPHQAGLGNPDNYGVVFCCMLGDKLLLPAFNFTDGIEVWTYDGLDFECIGRAGDPGCWDSSQLLGSVAYSSLEERLYMGTSDLDFITPTGGELYAYDQSGWSLVADSGIDNVNNLFFYPLCRGEDLYLASGNVAQGCRVYQRTGNGFSAISGYGLGEAANMNALIASYSGELITVTSNANGGQVWTTPIAPSIDRIVPRAAPRGQRVRIEGHDFLNNQGGGIVTFNGTPVQDYLSWSDTAIEVLVPPGATDGPVRVSQPNGDSNEVDFTVKGTYYFAEGYTGTGFQEYLCIGNANDAAVSATITYMFPDGSTQDQPVDIPAKSRTTVNVNAAVGPDRDVSAMVTSIESIVVERPMYFLYGGVWSGGHDAVGATESSTTWYFAEGYTGTGFEEWVCVLNPGDSRADLTFRFMTQEEGLKEITGFSVAAHSRASFKANQILGNDYQTSLELISTRPVVAERPMYFSYQGTNSWNWTGGHCVMGTPELSRSYYFAEGTTRSNFEEWLTLQNPNPDVITIQATYQLGPGQGDPVQAAYEVPGNWRRTIYVPSEAGTEKDVSVLLTCAEDFLAERPMYFDYSFISLKAQGGHCVIGSPQPASDWFLAEGYTGTGFNQWICLQNPGDADATVEINYYTQEAGPLATITLPVPTRTRNTIMVNYSAGADYQLSTGIRVTSGPDIVVERPMYFDFSIWEGGHDVVGYAP